MVDNRLIWCMIENARKEYLPVRRSKKFGYLAEAVITDAGAVITGRGNRVWELLSYLNEIDLRVLHYFVVREIKRHPTSKHLFSRIYTYVRHMSSYHKGLFWTVFNAFHKDVSKQWYESDERYSEAISNALFGVDGRVRDSIEGSIIQESTIRVMRQVNIERFGLKKS